MNNVEHIHFFIEEFGTEKIDEIDFRPDFRPTILMYISSKSKDLSETTLTNYQTDLELFAKQVRKPLTEITEVDIQKYLETLNDCKDSTIQKKFKIINHFFIWLVEQGIIRNNPCEQLESPKAKYKRPRTLKKDELDILRQAATVRQRALIELIYSTGCHLQEICSLNRSDINFDFIEKITIGKDNKKRTLNFSYDALFYLKQYLDSRLDDCEALFVRERKPHERLTGRAIQQEIKKVAEKVGLEDKVNPSTIRNTYVKDKPLQNLVKEKKMKPKMKAANSIVPAEGFVYFIKEFHRGTIKIGRTKNLKNRLRIFGIQLPFEWELIHFIKTKHYTATEKLIQQMFNHKRIGQSEWFNLDDLDFKVIFENRFPKEVIKYLI